MAAGLNVIPIYGINNTYCQQLSQAMRNLKVGQNSFNMTLDIIIRAVEAPGGSVNDLADIMGISPTQAQVVHAETTSFGGQINSANLTAAWDQLNTILGISV
jgi:hypothetical protein